MILTTVLLILITLVVLLYSLFFKRSFTKVRLKEVYREKYHSDTEALERSLKAGTLTEAEYEHQKTELARDLLGGTVVVPGVSIGDNTVIGAGSIVTKDIPANVVAVGNPCRVMREIGERDKEYYYKDRKIGDAK